ncbi:MAG: NAD(P)H-binding protein [Bernardetiaceae bacterium]|nr:NAD(P)H-binding protein [Bernardetiaceae bacterium]
MSSSPSISILGCGWLGTRILPFLQKAGYQVKASTTTPTKLDTLRKIGATPYLLGVTPPFEPQDADLSFFNTDYIIIAIPPQTRRAEDIEQKRAYVEQMAYLRTYLLKNYRPAPKVIMISSTSVYPNTNGIVRESDVVKIEDAENHIILEAENVLFESHLSTTILRCGGLMGDSRIPGKYFAGKTNLTTGHIPVNFIHYDDVAGIILSVLEQDRWNEIYNVVAPSHPKRREIYLSNAKKFGFEAPTFDMSGQTPYKIVSADKLIKQLDYQFAYPDPLEFPYTTI